MKQQHRYEVGKRFQKAIHSRRVQISLASLLVALIVHLVPELESVRSEIRALVTAVILALVGDYAVRDATRVGHEGGKSDDEDEDLTDPHHHEV